MLLDVIQHDDNLSFLLVLVWVLLSCVLTGLVDFRLLVLFSIFASVKLPNALVSDQKKGACGQQQCILLQVN